MGIILEKKEGEDRQTVSVTEDVLERQINAAAEAAAETPVMETPVEQPEGNAGPSGNCCPPETEKPARRRCCWVTVGFIVLFAAVIVLFVLFFMQRGSSKQTNPALAELIEKGETPYMLTVNNDSIVAHFVLVELLTKDLEEETARYQGELQRKQSVLEEKYKNYQINVQKQVLTATQMQNAEKQLTEEAATLKNLQERYATILAGKQASVQREIADSIISVTTRINEKRYHAKYVFAVSEGSAVVYSSPEFDITEEVIAELNRSYEKNHGKNE